MKQHSVLIEIDGKAVPELRRDLLSLEVELDDQLVGMFRLTLASTLRPDGSWSYVDDARLAVWREVAITAGPADAPEQLLTGFITHVRPEFGRDLSHCRVVVWGMDRSVLMDRVDVLTDWPNTRDSDIATEVFLKYDLVPQVTDTPIVHEEEVSTIIQRETDLQLLQRLAARNGFECFVSGEVGYFGPPAVAAAPQPVLALQFGRETSLNRLSLEVNALAPADVAMFQVDQQTGEVLLAEADATSEPSLGSRRPGSFLPGDLSPGLVYIGQTVTTGKEEMAALVGGLRDQAEWFVTGEGEVAANQYGNILLPRRTVLIKGIGATYSGVYYVTHVTHRFGADGYTQDFKVKRNALNPTGAEVFAAQTGVLGALVGGSAGPAPAQLAGALAAAATTVGGAR